MLLPAAYHFTLSYRSGENVQETLEEQKKDILRMSHGVSSRLVLLSEQVFNALIFQVSIVLLFSKSTAIIRQIRTKYRF